MPRDYIANERIKIYFDLIVGSVLSVYGLVSAFFHAITFDIASFIGWMTGLIFWLSYLNFTLFLIGLGLYTRCQEKHYTEREPRKDLRVPIVS